MKKMFLVLGIMLFFVTNVFGNLNGFEQPSTDIQFDVQV